MGGGGSGARTHARPLQLRRAYPRDHRFRPGASTASTQQPGTRALHTTTPVNTAATINEIPSLPPPPSRPDSHLRRVDSRARGSSRHCCCWCCCCSCSFRDLGRFPRSTRAYETGTPNVADDDDDARASCTHTHNGRCRLHHPFCSALLAASDSARRVQRRRRHRHRAPSPRSPSTATVHHRINRRAAAVVSASSPDITSAGCSRSRRRYILPRTKINSRYTVVNRIKR